ncbi:Cold shock protein [Hoyosella subflava DQS3-9A1]|uniref:Cold shock protein n=1 Tax=Hoyosella subflava (strain DSM 45089 / JCM 17490 / NBRC 109087 / DQS3-9A1) TaxID=443218 RepID=F6EM83_HOYSD|nr:Cold shock protein [Hoyosella subflava DQS3-9A1]
MHTHARADEVASDERVTRVPTGKVKWYDAEKGFGFLSQDDGEDVHVRSAALPSGVESLKPGQRVEFGMAVGRRGPQALSVKVLDPLPSIRQAARKEAPVKRRSPDELHSMIEDMIKLLEASVQPSLDKGRYPERKQSQRLAEVIRAVARELDA